MQQAGEETAGECGARFGQDPGDELSWVELS
jgi:hypothetical protein